jgi:uncharacterized protein
MAIELDNSFTVPVPPEQAWDVLLDVERIAPCMPGAKVLAVDGDQVEGEVKVKLGPLSLTYRGTAKFLEKDQEAQRITIEANGKDIKGAGTASANVTANLRPGDTGAETVVSIHTVLNVTGKPAQFGRSFLPEVSGRLIQQFAVNLETMITTETAGVGAAVTDTATADTPAPAADAAPAAETGEAPVQSADAAATAPAAAVTKPAAPVAAQEDSLNAFTFIVVPILKRLAPVAAVAAAGAAITVVVRRIRGKKS